MRPGLVVIGVAFLTLTVGTFASLYLPAAPGPSTSVHTFTGLPEPAPAKAAGSSPAIDPVNASATFLLTWRSTVDLNVSWPWGAGPSCGGGLPCAPFLQPLATWTNQSSGSWSFSGRLSGPLYLEWTNAGASGGSISFTLRQTITSGSGLAGVGGLLVDASLVILAAIGALALFLGVFLRAGVYRGPPRLVSRGPEDAEAIAAGGTAGATGPRTAPSSDGSGGPRRTPSAPPGKAPPS
ncbi:MAG: hypothetical protein L3K23_01405 [Thermoplasmata archaeon]|nr:hypothetical protein [Thermoplasmata archaeon]